MIIIPEYIAETDSHYFHLYLQLYWFEIRIIGLMAGFIMMLCAAVLQHFLQVASVLNVMCPCGAIKDSHHLRENLLISEMPAAL